MPDHDEPGRTLRALEQAAQFYGAVVREQPAGDAPSETQEQWMVRCQHHAGIVCDRAADHSDSPHTLDALLTAAVAPWRACVAELVAADEAVVTMEVHREEYSEAELEAACRRWNEARARVVALLAGDSS